MRLEPVVEMKRARQNPPETLPREAASGDRRVFRSAPEGDRFRGDSLRIKPTSADLSIGSLVPATLPHAGLNWHSFNLG